MAAADESRRRAVEPLFQSALAFHEQGALARAEHLYREVLRQHPQHAAALNMLGVLGCQNGRHQAGIALMRRALDLEPDNADFNNNLGQALHERGDPAAARSAFERAVALRPRHAAAHCNLANACRVLGDLAQAEQHYRKTLALSPQHLDALINLATLLREHGRAPAALPLCERAVALAPSLALAQANLAWACAAVGQFERAVVACERALERDATMITLWSLLGDCRRRLGLLEAAATAYRQAVTLAPAARDTWLALGLTELARGLVDPARACFERAQALAARHPPTLTGLGMVSAAAGDRDLAQACFEQAIEIDPACGEAWRQLAELISEPDAARRALVALAVALARDDLAARARSELEFARGRLCDLLEQRPQAFAAWRRANDAKRAQVAFDARAQGAYIDAIIATFDLAYVDRAAAAGVASEVPLLIVGMPRSGTTLVEQILASHPAVHGAGELTFWPEQIGRTGSKTRPFPAAVAGGVEPLRQHATHYLALLAERGGAALRVTDKMPYNFLYLGVIATLLPGATVVHCRRHAMATCFSIYTRDLAGNHPYAYALADLASAYAGYARLMAHWHTVLPGRIVNVDYEALVAAPEAGIRDLLERVGLPWDPACLRFHDSPRAVTTASQWQVRRPIYGEARAHWRAYANELAPLATALAAYGIAV